MSYLTLANDWAKAVFHRLIAAHARGDDVVALDAARRLDAFRKAVDRRATAMGFASSFSRTRMDEPPRRVYLEGLELLEPLLADHERRAKDRPRGPVPRREAGGDPSPRIAALIRDLDQVQAAGHVEMGGDSPEHDPIVLDVIAEGEPAVEPLIAALATDARMTRTTQWHNGNFVGVVPVSRLIHHSLQGLLRTNRLSDDGRDDAELQSPEGRKHLAEAARAF